MTIDEIIGKTEDSALREVINDRRNPLGIRIECSKYKDGTEVIDGWCGNVHQF